MLAYKSSDDITKLWSESKKDTSANLSTKLFENVIIRPSFFINEKTNAQAFCYKKDNVLYITFRGTQEQHDIIVDIDTFLEQLFPTNKQILIHTGFLQQFYSLEPFLTDEIEKYIDYIDTIHFTGHSLGAALATLASAYYGYLFKVEKNRIVKTICHTFGCPRLGNLHFIQWFKQHVDENVRIVNEKDIVPTIPFSGSYSHVSDSITINDTLEEIVKNDLPWYLRILYLPFKIDYSSPIRYHSCIMYLERMLHFANFDKKLDFKNLL